MRCNRCRYRLASCLCIECGAIDLCTRCRLLPHQEHAARWEAQGIYFPGCPLKVDAAYAIYEAEMYLFGRMPA